ncbi:Lrp/AsnC family transcriptional regulator [Mammaliicoccus vitulinus]|nr:Lrp/AsnC family transcriptional regulator [Mammaliicoccus vitulinus]
MDDFINEKILEILKENSRMTINELSKKINLSAPATRERVNKLEDQDIINGYTIDINYKKLGYNIEVIVEIIIKNNLYDDFKKYINSIDNVDFCYRVSGDACYIFKVSFEDMEKVELFIDDIQPYGHTKKLTLYFPK